MTIGVSSSETLLFPECIELLEAAAEQGVMGRLAISTDRAPIVEPVTFDYEDRAIVVCAGTGLLAESAPGALVAFEVDHLDISTGRAWTVLVRGLATSREEAYRPRTALDLLAARDQAVGAKLLVVRLDVVTGRRFALERPEASPRRVQRVTAPAVSGAARSARP
jgi:hypothetical protein